MSKTVAETGRDTVATAAKAKTTKIITISNKMLLLKCDSTDMVLWISTINARKFISSRIKKKHPFDSIKNLDR